MARSARGLAGDEPSASLDAHFESGFLAEVYRDRPVGVNGIDEVVTRFPPEPNGFLHLGHSKAIATNFGFARYHGGRCILRFDDTNPVGEEGVFFDSIEEIVSWLGFKPARVTYTSDNFERLYELAEDLINMDCAYVCHCSGMCRLYYFVLRVYTKCACNNAQQTTHCISTENLCPLGRS